MPSAIVVTVGSASANSYVTLDEATTYLDDQLNSSAFQTNAEDQTRALISATRELDLVRWNGQVVDDTQVLAWPRKNAEDPDNPNSQAGDARLGLFGETEIPQRVQDAQVEIALEMLVLGTTRFTALPADFNELESVVGPLEAVLVEQRRRRTGLGRFPRAMNLIAPMIDPVATGLRVVRV